MDTEVARGLQIWDQHREHRAVSATNQTCAECPEERFPCQAWEHALEVLAQHHGIPLFVAPPSLPGGASATPAPPGQGTARLPSVPYAGTGYDLPMSRPGT